MGLSCGSISETDPLYSDIVKPAPSQGEAQVPHLQSSVQGQAWASKPCSPPPQMLQSCEILRGGPHLQSMPLAFCFKGPSHQTSDQILAEVLGLA